ncbi:MAG: hypothetical protein QOE92_2096, partial [Chloroflexota bacterium]|nr:hypothetical protein [Chloroflexota bacterium]
LAAGAFASAMGVLVLDATARALERSQLGAEPNARGKAISRLLDDGSETAMKAARLIVESFEGEIKVPV